MPHHVPCIQGPLPSHSTTTADHVGRKGIILYQHLNLFWDCLFINAEWTFSLFLHPMGSLLSLSSMPLNGLLKRSVTGLGYLKVICVNCICNKDLHMSALVPYHFFMVLLTNFIEASACPLL